MSTSLETLSARIGRAQAVMAEQQIDYLFVTPSSDLVYMLDYPSHATERLTLLAIPRQGRPWIVSPAFEAVRLERQRALLDVHAWTETESPFELVARQIPGSSALKVAVSDQTWSTFTLNLMAELDGARFVPAGPLMRELRMSKDSEELAALREAAARTDRAWERFVAAGGITGQSETAVARRISALLEEEGLAVGHLPIVASGPNGASPHHLTGERIIQSGDVVVCDFGGHYQHYTSDVTRTVCVGEPDPEFHQVYATVLAANEAALQAIKPGVPCEAIDRAARDVITAAGYGEYFTHRLGHGIGLDGHEEPYMVGGNRLPLRAGMTFSDEPGIYIPGRFGVRIEDIVVCTESGGERLNHARRDVTVVN